MESLTPAPSLVTVDVNGDIVDYQPSAAAAAATSSSQQCRPFSHALVDDVERWIRDGNYVHLVVDKIIGALLRRSPVHLS